MPEANEAPVFKGIIDANKITYEKLSEAEKAVCNAIIPSDMHNKDSHAEALAVTLQAITGQDHLLNAGGTYLAGRSAQNHIKATLVPKKIDQPVSLKGAVEYIGRGSKNNNSHRAYDKAEHLKKDKELFSKVIPLQKKLCQSLEKKIETKEELIAALQARMNLYELRIENGDTGGFTEKTNPKHKLAATRKLLESVEKGQDLKLEGLELDAAKDGDLDRLRKKQEEKLPSVKEQEQKQPPVQRTSNDQANEGTEMLAAPSSAAGKPPEERPKTPPLPQRST